MDLIGPTSKTYVSKTNVINSINMTDRCQYCLKIKDSSIKRRREGKRKIFWLFSTCFLYFLRDIFLHYKHSQNYWRVISKNSFAREFLQVHASDLNKTTANFDLEIISRSALKGKLKEQEGKKILWSFSTCSRCFLRDIIPSYSTNTNKIIRRLYQKTYPFVSSCKYTLVILTRLLSILTLRWFPVDLCKVRNS